MAALRLQPAALNPFVRRAPTPIQRPFFAAARQPGTRRTPVPQVQRSARSKKGGAGTRSGIRGGGGPRIVKGGGPGGPAGMAAAGRPSLMTRMRAAMGGGVAKGIGLGTLAGVGLMGVPMYEAMSGRRA